MQKVWGYRPFSKPRTWEVGILLRPLYSDTAVTDLTRENCQLGHNKWASFYPSLFGCTPEDQVPDSPSNHSFLDLERGLAPCDGHFRAKPLSRDTAAEPALGESRT